MCGVARQWPHVTRDRPVGAVAVPVAAPHHQWPRIMAFRITINYSKRRWRPSSCSSVACLCRGSTPSSRSFTLLYALRQHCTQVERACEAAGPRRIDFSVSADDMADSVSSAGMMGEAMTRRAIWTAAFATKRVGSENRKTSERRIARVKYEESVQP